MFDFELGDDLELIVETAKSFAQEELFPTLREHESGRAVQPSTRKTFAEMGLAGAWLKKGLHYAFLYKLSGKPLWRYIP